MRGGRVIRSPRTAEPGPAVAAAVGLVAAALALGLAELVAGALGRPASPAIVVGGAAIDRTPRFLKEFAIEQFGENDKAVLLGGIFTVIALIAAAVGVLATRHRRAGLAGVALLGLVAAAAAASRPASRPVDVLPSLVAAAVGVFALAGLLRATGTRRTGDAATAGTSTADTSTAGTSTVDTSTAGTSTVDTSTAGTSTIDTSTAGTSTIDTSTAGTSNADMSTAGTSTADVTGDGAVRDPRRRGLLVTAAVALTAAVTGVGGRALQGLRTDVEASRRAVVLPEPLTPAGPLPAGAELDVPGISSFYTANREFYRVDTALSVPRLTTDEWRLTVHGMVERELDLSYADLLERPIVERDITMTCVSNEVGGKLLGTARWLGVELAPLLREAGVRPGSTQLVGTSVDGMTIGTPVSAVMDGRAAMLAVAMNGEPLPPEHGFPVRMIVPGLYGYVSATKWLVDLELSTFDAFDPYWVRRGWAKEAPIKTSSRIDTPKPLSTVKPGRVAVAGIAWAQHRGISRVEVRVDGGPWREARLSTSVTPDLWRQWLWEWDAPAGSHTLQVRATDADGEVQVEDRAAPFPSGSTGWQSVLVTVAG